MTVDLIVDRLTDAWQTILDAWSILVILAVAIVGVAGVTVRLSYRRQIADLEARLELSDRQVAEAKAEICRMERNLKALEGERENRRNLEDLLASLREQLATTQRQLVACRKPTKPPPGGSRRQTTYDELFGPGEAIDGKLTKGEAERLIVAVQEITDLMKLRLGLGGTTSPLQAHSRLASSTGPAWWLYVAKKGIPHIIELVAAYRADLIDFANSLEATITRQPDLEFRLRKIVGNVGLIAGHLNIVGGYIRSMERLNDGEVYKPAILEMALGDPFKNMVQAQATVDKWMQLFVEQRAPAVHKEAVTYL